VQWFSEISMGCWWFGTWLLFSIIIIWNNHPSHWLSYFSRWLKPPTSHEIVELFDVLRCFNAVLIFFGWQMGIC
jgi:hypothetical protein